MTESEKKTLLKSFVRDNLTVLIYLCGDGIYKIEHRKKGEPQENLFDTCRLNSMLMYCNLYLGYELKSLY